MASINLELEHQAREALLEIGANVQLARKDAFRESREVFAKRLGCSVVTLDHIEQGEPVSSRFLMRALVVIQVARDVVAATSPKLLITMQIPAEFPADFPSPPAT